jgi:hypothetical protein
MVKKTSNVAKGQYIFPFTISLPKNGETKLPSSFSLDEYQVTWVLEVSFNDKFRDSVLSCQRVINIQFPIKKQSFIMH